MPRNYGIMSGRLTRGASRQPSAAGADTRADSNIIHFARGANSLPLRVDLGDSRRPFFIPAGASFKLRKILHALFDIFALAFCIGFILITGLSITVSLFLLLFYATY